MSGTISHHFQPFHTFLVFFISKSMKCWFLGYAFSYIFWSCLAQLDLGFFGVWVCFHKMFNLCLLRPLNLKHWARESFSTPANQNIWLEFFEIGKPNGTAAQCGYCLNLTENVFDVPKSSRYHFSKNSRVLITDQSI